AGPVVAVAALASLVFAGASGAADVRVQIGSGPPPALAELASGGAVGLVVPGAGATVTRRGAVAALVRGKVENALLGGTPSGRPVIAVSAGRRLLSQSTTITVWLPPPGRHPNTRRYPIVVEGPGLSGRVDSSTTRIP